MTDSTTESADRLVELASGIRVAMLTTPESTGALRSRPLTVQRVDADGTVWFLVDAQADWVADRIPTVNLALSDDTTWISISGSAELVLDTAVIEELGDPVSDAWFGEGTTPAALRVEIGHADYWDGPGKLQSLVRLGTGAVTGNRPDMGDRGVVEP
jgi:general stress protein 26